MEAQQGTRLYEIPLTIEAGEHEIAAGFLNEYLLPETSSEGDLKSAFNYSVDYVLIGGPYATTGVGIKESQERIFICRPVDVDQEEDCARKILSNLARRGYRGPVTTEDINPLIALFSEGRKDGGSFEHGIEMALSGLLVSPRFLYRSPALPEGGNVKEIYELSDIDLASRLSFFLWSSSPDDELLKIAAKGKLRDPKIIREQTRRLLANPKAERFAHHFTRQWLGLESLDFLKLDKKTYRDVDPLLMEEMTKEPIAFFKEVLKNNDSIMHFLNSNYAVINDRLARHYNLPEVFGNEFRPVKLPLSSERGGVLTQAGLLAMNSDGKDSHPLKRGIWLLENILNDPPPPPPPAVPEIDLADPEILKLTLKERMEDHRNDPACMSCHVKIDPWGIAFENFDAVGKWRDSIGKNPVDSTSKLYNKHELRGIDGLKDYLMDNRQDQFARALCYKMASYALGRPLTFGDRSLVEKISSQLREDGDGLADLVILIVQSDLFQLK